MENKTDYEKAKAEWWEKYHRNVVCGTASHKYWFDLIFEAAYRYGLEAAKAQPENTSAHIPEAEKKVDRTMIAAMAMQGIIADEQYLRTFDVALSELRKNGKIEEMPVLVAQEAVKYADALIAELKKEKE